MIADSLAGRRVLVVGLGGLGCPALWCLLAEADLTLVLLDDDLVDESNLGRQVLYRDADVGRSKTAAARQALMEHGVAAERIVAYEQRLLPETARELVRGVDLVLEGADNYATKFLAADACHLEGVPIVHGSAIGWRATAWAVSATGAPCYRCLFEDLPQGPTANCDNAGVIGPVTGIAGALMADLALSVLRGQARHDILLTFDGLSDRLREVTVEPRRNCALCGTAPSILTIDEQRYTGQTCAA